MFELGAFIALSALLAYLSRASLQVPQSHGFFRFFAAVFVLALILLNVEQWFVDPLSARQAVSWVLLAVSAALVLCGALTLRAVGNPSSERTSDVPIAAIERTTALVGNGVYKYIRHPMYASGQSTARSNRRIWSTWYSSKDTIRVITLSRWGCHFMKMIVTCFARASRRLRPTIYERVDHTCCVQPVVGQ
jgi:protein-S-isoprenylcysteine O-methyltransferase Ste14